VSPPFQPSVVASLIVTCPCRLLLAWVRAPYDGAARRLGAGYRSSRFHTLV